MPITLPGAERSLSGADNAVPAFMFDMLSAWGFRAVTLAFRTGVLAALAEEELTSEQVAEKTELDPRGIAFLLDCLDCVGYVRRAGDRYGVTDTTRELLPMISMGIPYFEKIVFTDWANLEGRLRGELPLPFGPDQPRTPRWLARQWRVFQDGMVALTNMNIDEVLERVPVPDPAGHLLDLGGGYGLYSIALCRRHPQLRATIFEIPEMQRLADRAIAENGMADRVDFRAGDFFTDELGSPSMALLFNVIHSKSAVQNRELVARTAAALRPGGSLVILDQFPAPELGPIGRSFGAMMALSMFNSVGQQTYPLDEVRAWLTDAGLVDVDFQPVRSAPGNGLFLARKPGR
ncbi:methyltransferase [Micromonospora wenchangensis]|uniref:methyltransferase n=1 Tax=Micromonospora wenchangensis TaxID=1185415 RepID=UPI003D75A1B5